MSDQNQSNQSQPAPGQPQPMPRPGGSVEGTPDATGQPGVESALGRDRTQGELPRDLGTNRREGDSRAELDRVAPPPGAVEGTRIGQAGDPTGAEDEEQAP